MVTTGAAEFITSDSTTHIQNAVSKNYYFHPEMNVPPRYMSLGYRGKGAYRPNHYNTLPCTCQVCSAIKYKDVYGALSGHPIDTLMIYHNLFATYKYQRAMYEIVASTTTKELQEILRFQFGNKKTRRSGTEEMVQAIAFIDSVKENGLKEARKEFKYFLPTDSGADVSNATLFQRNTVKKVVETSEDDEVFKKMDAYARKYELSEGSHGKKIHKKGQVSAIQSVKSVGRPGKRKKKTSKKSKANKPLKEVAT
jgi:hypothetical protein